MLYKSINKYQKWWVYIKNKSKHNIGLLYFVDIKRTILHLRTAYWVFPDLVMSCPELAPV
ncbi:hypothetical protein HYD54_03980 [Mycoplasmopsis bovis]|nr:hypothetical protein [Mycoplasmopsis bovis]QQH71945.1 hypothetical protein HYD54_03980 [Mycoplasmopsis bovis]